MMVSGLLALALVKRNWRPWWWPSCCLPYPSRCVTSNGYPATGENHSGFDGSGRYPTILKWDEGQLLNTLKIYYNATAR